jgi:FtsP/CotA-like multicopper oxidase with cupredoxin domain
MLKLSGMAAVAASLPAACVPGIAQALATAEYKLEIGPVTWELGPRRTIKTTAYNGQIPGPLLRFREGQPVTVEVVNRTESEDVIHFHGLFLPSAIDGAMEEGTPMIAAGASARYTFTPRPAGFRWYHTHTMAMGNLTLAQYGGQHGLMMVEAGNDPGAYDAEFFLALHDWAGHLLASDDGAMNPTYDVTTINGKMMGAGEPLRVKQGQRVLLHVLNSSPTEVHWVSLAGHTLRVIALDGNTIPSPQAVPMLRLAPAERVCVVVEMNNPGVWVLGEVREHVQKSGMAVVVEYAGQTGKPVWEQPQQLVWNYEQFGDTRPEDEAQRTPSVIPMVFASKFRGHGAMEQWTINGQSYPDAPKIPLKQGQRYRLQFINRSSDNHPVHLHRHSFEVRTLGAELDKHGEVKAGSGKALRGVMKDVLLVDGQTQAEVEFTADNPGLTLFHCHQQNHMDLGFMRLFDYV